MSLLEHSRVYPLRLDGNGNGYIDAAMKAWATKVGRLSQHGSDINGYDLEDCAWSRLLFCAFSARSATRSTSGATSSLVVSIFFWAYRVVVGVVRWGRGGWW